MRIADNEVREALGVRLSDNLQNARLVLLVEGGDDAKALKAIVGSRSERLRRAMENGTVAVDYLGGASGLRQKALFYRTGACMVQCFIDNDAEGVKHTNRVIEEKVLDVRDVNLCSVAHLKESELEDLYDKKVYGEAFLKEFGVDLSRKTTTIRKGKEKWSDVLEALCREAGKPWNDGVETRMKNWLAEYAACNCERILNEKLASPVDNFIFTAENKLFDDE